MSPNQQSDKPKSSQLDPKGTKPKQQCSEKSSTNQTHAQDAKKAANRVAEGIKWDNYIDGQSQS